MIPNNLLKNRNSMCLEIRNHAGAFRALRLRTNLNQGAFHLKYVNNKLTFYTARQYQSQIENDDRPGWSSKFIELNRVCLEVVGKSLREEFPLIEIDSDTEWYVERDRRLKMFEKSGISESLKATYLSLLQDEKFEKRTSEWLRVYKVAI
jgi:hypothetical protein